MGNRGINRQVKHHHKEEHTNPEHGTYDRTNNGFSNKSNNMRGKKKAVENDTW